MASSMTGATAAIGPWPLALSSTAPPVASAYSAGRVAAKRAMAGASALTTVAGWVSSTMVERTVTVGRRSRRHTMGCSSPSRSTAKLSSGTTEPLDSGTWRLCSVSTASRSAARARPTTGTR